MSHRDISHCDIHPNFTKHKCIVTYIKQNCIVKMYTKHKCLVTISVTIIKHKCLANNNWMQLLQ